MAALLPFVLAALLLGGLASMVLVFVRRRRAWFAGEAHGEAVLAQAERETLMREIRELDVSLASGKLSDKDHAAARTDALARVEELTARLDKANARARDVREKAETRARELRAGKN